MEESPLDRAILQFETLPSGPTRTRTPTSPLGMPVAASLPYSKFGMLLTSRAGVKRE